jgi:nicotinate-nucleotide adenylyltransferase
MRIGIFGGTFDPPHLGHLIAAQDARTALGLDRIRFVPAHRSPLKTEDSGTTPEDRFELVCAATAGDEQFEVSRDELDRPAPSYTVDSLAAWTRAEPGIQFTLLIGLDQWASFDQWREPEQIGRMAHIGVLKRGEGDARQVAPNLDVAWTEVPVTRIDISSTQVREYLREGRSVRYLVPEAVRSLIEAKGLYSTC